MIKGITSGVGIQINGGNYSTWPTIYNTAQSTGNTAIGQVRYNGSSQNLEVYDGNSWLIMSSAYPTIELSPDVQSVINWARMKMDEERRIKELAARHPAVADALAAVEQAQEQVRVVAALVDNV